MDHTLIYVRRENGIELKFPNTIQRELSIPIFATTVDHTVMMKAINNEPYLMDDEVKQKLTATVMSSERKKTFLETKLDENKDFIIFIYGGNSVAMCNNIKDFLAEDNVLDVDKLLKHLYKENEILLIVGIADGLETELIDDIRVTCREAGLESRIDSILRQCSSTSDEKPIEIVERSDHTLLRITVSPTIQEFKEFMERAILESCCRHSLAIVYCGHGTEAGAICLFDGDYDGAELKNLLDEQFIGNFPSFVHLYLNCCYAINVASKINNEDELQKLINLFPGLVDTHIKQESMCIISKAYYGDQNANERIQILMRDKLPDRTFFYRPWRQLKLHVYPLSVGILKAQGLLCVAIGVQQTTDEAHQVQSLKFRSRWYEKEDHNSKECLNKLFAPKAPLLPKDSSTPKVKVFGAKHGDSALFRWKEWNVLIDGGYDSGDPCFRDSICKLKQLDVVVLTHGDSDHINGLLPLFKKLSNDKKDNPTTYTKLVQNAAFLYPDMQNQRTWSQAKTLYRYANDAEIECTGIRTLEFPGPNKKIKLVIKFIHPPPEGNLLERAITKLQNARSDLINESSLVVCIECWIDRECKYRLLFTGDSYGNDVIEALEKNNLLDKEFSYVDMPHHGSKKNDPEMFLENIKTRNIGVSTDGSRGYGHPNEETLEELSNYMERTPSCRLHFNYKQGDKYDKLLRKFKERVYCPPDDQTSGFELPLRPAIDDMNIG